MISRSPSNILKPDDPTRSPPRSRSGLPNPSFVAVAGFGSTGPIALAACDVASDAIDAAAIDTGGFRFGKLLDYRNPAFLPGGAKYLDIPGFIAVAATHRLWIAGEPELAEKYGNKTDTNDAGRTIYLGGKPVQEAAAEWLSM
ncbi:MAG TPA: hypothetical protein VHU84_16440 [Lacipirellulaceae bacterium]|nr:hypothetical protein [Lacipirellulaceae bacterium]